MIDYLKKTRYTHDHQITYPNKQNKKILASLKRGGTFINGDYTCETLEQEQFYHYDTPMTAETELKLLRAAGFATAETLKSWENTSIIAASKE